MRAIITGGSGLIGRALTESLASSGHEVIVLSRDPGRVSGLPDGARAVRWDGRTTEGWAQLCEDAAIINLAGENLSSGRWTGERKRRIRQSRLDAGGAVAAVAAAERKPHVVVQASAVGYYGFRGDEELDEGSSPGDDYLARVCQDWEASTAPVEALGVRRVIIRTAPVLSRTGGMLPRLALPFRFFVGGRLGSGRQWFPWIHISDEVGAIRFLLENEQTIGPFNLSSPHPTTNAQFSRLLGRLMSRPALIPAPSFALRILLGEMATALLGGQRVVPRRLLDAGFTFAFPDAFTALRDLLG